MSPSCFYFLHSCCQPHCGATCGYSAPHMHCTQSNDRTCMGGNSNDTCNASCILAIQQKNMICSKARTTQSAYNKYRIRTHTQLHITDIYKLLVDSLPPVERVSVVIYTVQYDSIYRTCLFWSVFWFRRQVVCVNPIIRTTHALKTLNKSYLFVSSQSSASAIARHVVISIAVALPLPGG